MSCFWCDADEESWRSGESGVLWRLKIIGRVGTQNLFEAPGTWRRGAAFRLYGGEWLYTVFFFRQKLAFLFQLRPSRSALSIRWRRIEQLFAWCFPNLIGVAVACIQLAVWCCCCSGHYTYCTRQKGTVELVKSSARLAQSSWFTYPLLLVVYNMCVKPLPRWHLMRVWWCSLQLIRPVTVRPIEEQMKSET